jgi:hypothetical protein
MTQEVSFHAPHLIPMWTEPLRVDKKLSKANSWRKTYEKDEAALQSRLQDISTS